MARRSNIGTSILLHRARGLRLREVVLAPYIFTVLSKEILHHLFLYPVLLCPVFHGVINLDMVYLLREPRGSRFVISCGRRPPRSIVVRFKEAAMSCTQCWSYVNSTVHLIVASSCLLDCCSTSFPCIHRPPRTSMEESLQRTHTIAESAADNMAIHPRMESSLC